MHHPRYYRNSSVYHSRGVTYGGNISQIARNTYKRSSATPFSPSHRDKYSSQQSAYGNSSSVDRSKYVWTANKQQNQEQIRQPPQNLVQEKQKPVVTQFIKTRLNNAFKELAPLAVTSLDTTEVVARDIATKLHEEKFYLIRKVVEIIGVKKAIKLYYETRLKESSGGILIQNGKRRRTPGGVFLSVLRETNFISPEEVTKVFNEIKRHELQMKIAHF